MLGPYCNSMNLLICKIFECWFIFFFIEEVTLHQVKNSNRTKGDPGKGSLSPTLTAASLLGNNLWPPGVKSLLCIHPCIFYARTNTSTPPSFTQMGATMVSAVQSARLLGTASSTGGLHLGRVYPQTLAMPGCCC